MPPDGIEHLFRQPLLALRPTERTPVPPGVRERRKRTPQFHHGRGGRKRDCMVNCIALPKCGLPILIGILNVHVYVCYDFGTARNRYAVITSL